MGNISSIARGGSPRPIDDYLTNSPEGVNWIKIGDTEKDGKYIYKTKEKIKKEGISKSRLVHKGDFLLTNSMSFGRPYILKTDGCIHDGWLVIGNIDGIFDQDYLYYVLSSNFMYAELSKVASGSTVQNLKSDTVKNVLFPIPPIHEQKIIASKISSLLNFIDRINEGKADLITIIQKTKSKILDLAIRGKLVSQDPNDEPASELLERIQNEKEELIKAGKLKRDKRESVIFRGEDNSYYLRTGKLVEPLTDWNFDDLPKNWEICCFGEICNYGDCINVESSLIENGAWILDLEDIEKDTGRILSRISKEDRRSISTKHKFNKGQVLYSKLRPYLNKVVLADQDGYCTSEILPLEFHSVITPEYARYYLMSPTFLRYADKCSYGVKMPRLGTNDGKKAIFPLPPINEQRRIVKQIEFMFSHLSDIETRVQ